MREIGTLICWATLERQNELIKIEYEKSQRENKDLKAENEKLKKALKKKEVAFIKGL